MALAAIQNALRLSEKRGHRLIQSNILGVVVEDFQGRILDANDAFLKMIGYDRQDVRSGRLNWKVLTPPDQLPLSDRAIAEMRNTGISVPYQKEYIRRDGSRVPILIGMAALNDHEESAVGFVLDLSDRKRAEEALRASEEEFRAIFDTSGNGLAVSDPVTRRFLRVNRKMCELTGYSNEELTGGMGFMDITHPEERARDVDIFRRMASGEVSAYEVDKRYVHKDGRVFWVHLAATLTHDLQGRPLRVMASVSDVTEHVKEIRREKTFSESVVRSSVDGILAFDRDFRYTVWNPGMEKISGVKAEEALGRNAFDVFPFLRESGEDAYFRRALEGETSVALDRPYHVSDTGRKGFFEGYYSPLRGESGDIIGGVAIIRDVTARKEAEKSLLQREEQFRSVAETAHDAIICSDSAGKITYFNKGAEAIFGYPAEEVMDRSLTILMPDKFRAPHETGMRRYAATGEAHVVGKTIELTGRRKNGEEFPLELSLASWKAGEKLYFTAILRDITHRKKIEKELLRARDEAVQYGRMKAQFLANMSHEIRTPLNALIGLSGLMLNTSLTSEQEDYAETIRDSADSLLTIINNILDFSKIEAGKMGLQEKDFDLRRLVQETANLFAPEAVRKNLTLKTECAADVAGSFRGDPDRLRQVMVNLMGNAVKFTEKGGIMIRASSEEETGGRTLVKVEVQDTGIGVSEEDQPRLFKPFIQADGSSTRKFGGTGLGLAISKEIIELMNGSIGVRSVPGEGSVFWFKVWLAKTAAPVTTAASPEPARFSSRTYSPRVLVAEDNAVNRKVILAQLQSLGLRPHAVTNGHEAVKAFDESSFDLVFMDCQMPELDGYTATRRIRQKEKGPRRVPIIAMTAHAMEGDREKCLAAGMDDYLSKPVHLEDLTAALAKWTRSPSNTASF
jgi:PAS domain S-box-containing protein